MCSVRACVTHRLHCPASLPQCSEGKGDVVGVFISILPVPSRLEMQSEAGVSENAAGAVRRGLLVAKQKPFSPWREGLFLQETKPSRGRLGEGTALQVPLLDFGISLALSTSHARQALLASC